MPTIADAIGAEIPWEVDGVSLVRGDLPERPIEMENLRGGGVELTAAEFTAALDDALGPASRLARRGQGQPV